MLQEFFFLPSTKIAQLPHCPKPQPNFVPVNPNSSLITNINGLSSLITTFLLVPFIFKLHSILDFYIYFLFNLLVKLIYQNVCFHSLNLMLI